MNILFIHGVSDLYGASRSLLRLATRLVRDGQGVTVALAEAGPLVARLEAAGVRVHVQADLPVIHRHLLRSPRGWIRLIGGWPRAVRGIAALAREVRADLIHTNQAMIPGVGSRAARRLGIPHIQHVREFFSEAPLLWLWYRRLLVSGSTRIICVSHAVAAQFRRGDSRVVVLHNGFPRAEFYGLDPRLVSEFRARHGLEGHPTAGVVGRIKMGRKGQDVFIRAAANVAARIPSARFVVAGAPFPGNEEHERSLRRLAEELRVAGHVMFTGELSDARVALAAVDVVVQPAALPEPFGGTVIEAMALGKPVIGTDTGGTAEQIEPGVTGELIPPGDVRSLADRIAHCMRDPAAARSMGEKGRERFLRDFEFEPFYRTLSELYAESRR